MTHDDDHDVLAPGTRVQEFRVERLLGRGGFGATYLAWDESMEARRAVKEYLPTRWWGRRLRDGTVGPAAGREQEYRWGLERFVHEARVLADSRLNHPHVVRVYRWFEARGTAYLVMERVEGRSLASALAADGWWPEARVRPLLSGLSDGLSAVHAAGLLHRDVSPANVMLRTGDDSPVLIDFGTARRLEQRDSGSRPLVKDGYAAFEQYKGEWEAYKGSAAYERTGTAGVEKHDQGPWTDVYGLGAVAYVALSGVVPPAATARFLHDALRPVASVAKGPVSGELASAVDAALAVLPWQRPQSMGAWRARWLGAPSLAAGADAPPPPPKRRRPAYGWAAAALLVAAAGVAGWWLMSGGSGDGGGSASASGPSAGSPESIEAALGLDRAARRRVQAGLSASGYAPGVADGRFGPETRRTIRAWQGARGKPETGFLDGSDLEALLAAADRAARVEEQRRVEAERRRLEELRRPGRVFRDNCAGCPEMVVLPAGEFTMGSPVSEEGRFDNEGPQRRVRVQPFALGRYEVTRTEYAAFAAATGRAGGDGCDVLGVETHDSGAPVGIRREVDPVATWESPGFEQGMKHPVVCVSWDDAQAYVRWLNQELNSETGRRDLYRLPSESEWEYAARAGTTTAYPWGLRAGDRCRHANGQDASFKAYLGERFGSSWNVPDDCTDRAGLTTAVGSYARNGFGLFDMIGNVWEWVEDCRHDGGYQGAPSDGRAWTSGGDCRRVFRGGSWYRDPRHLRAADSHRLVAGSRIDDLGFRVARTLD